MTPTPAEILRLADTYSNQRRGQAMMNALGELDIDAYRAITHTEGDCFYDDARIPRFWAELERIRNGA